MPNNTTGSEDRAIQKAGDVQGHVDELIAIIERLDGELEESKGIIQKQGKEIVDLQDEVSNVKAEREQLRAFNDEWVKERHRIAEG